MGNERLNATRLRDLAAAIEAIAAVPTLTGLIAIMRTTARRLIGADGISVVLREGAFCHYVEEDAIGPLWKGQRFLAEVCVSGWAMNHEQTAVIPDIATDPRVPYALYSETFVRSLVMAPIVAGRAIGALGAYWSDAHRPSGTAIATVETIARFAGLAVARFDEAALVSRGQTPSA
jgi:GAF domain-containing protein